jgi:hypothetical protein
MLDTNLKHLEALENIQDTLKAHEMVKLKATDIQIGYHPEGYRIDKTASPLNRYTQWDVLTAGKWVNPKPVCFHSLPRNGWHKINSFDWDKSNQ